MLSHGCIITFFVPINLYQFVTNCLFLVRKLCEYLNATLLLSTAFPPLQAIIYAVYCHHSRKRRTSLMNLTCMIIVIMWTIGLNLRMCHKNVAQNQLSNWHWYRRAGDVLRRAAPGSRLTYGQGCTINIQSGRCSASLDLWVIACYKLH